VIFAESLRYHYFTLTILKVYC